MDSEEKAILERTEKLSEENHKILKKMERRLRWAFIWGVVKILIIAIPLVIGYIYLQPHFEAAAANWNDIREFVEVSKQFLR